MHIEYKLIDHILNNIRLTQNLTCVLIMSVKNMQVVIFILLSKAIALDYNYNQF